MFSWLSPSAIERWFMIGGSFVGGAISFAFGDVQPLLKWLLIFIIVDFCTGTYGALRTGTWESKVCGIGITKKIIYFCIVALAHGLDETFSSIIETQIIESMTICAYMAGEFGSIIENMEKCGLGGAVPSVIRKMIHKLNDKIDNSIEKI